MLHFINEEINSNGLLVHRHEYWENHMYERFLAFKDMPKTPNKPDINPGKPFSVSYTYPPFHENDVVTGGGLIEG